MPGIYSRHHDLIHVISWILSPQVNWRFKQIQDLYQVKDEISWYDYWCAALSTLTLSLPNMTKGKFDKNPKFYFVHFFKTNNTTRDYYQRDFI